MEYSDTQCSQFLIGNISVSINMLHLIDISILQHIFTHLEDQKEYNEVKIVLLHFIIEKCKEKTILESIGGISFFQKILFSTDPQIA